MYQWLREKLGVIDLERKQDVVSRRIFALEKLVEGGTYEDYKKSKTSHGAERYDEIERARSRRKKART